LNAAPARLASSRTRKAKADKLVEVSFGAMASRCELRLGGLPLAALERAGQACVAEVRRIEYKYSRYRADSIVSRINAAAGSGAATEVDHETAGLLDFAAQLHAASDGLFDITSGVLRRAWDFKAARRPEQRAIDALLPLIGWQRVHWQGRLISLPDAGMELDFGGFGKEYAADRAHAILVDHGVSEGFVNLGGDIRIVGPRANGEPWRMGIQDPRQTDATVASLPLLAGALATSGDYERYFEQDGRRYCHILDPRTGWPVQAWRSISVVAPVCAAAGAVCTIAMLKGKDGLGFLEAQGLDYLAIDAQGRLVRSGADD
jgi:thiamine biosynthesis lipoprotein